MKHTAIRSLLLCALSLFLTTSFVRCAEQNLIPQASFEDAAAYWSMSDAGTKHAIQPHGNVTFGVELTGDERAASLTRGGDGQGKGDRDICSGKCGRLRRLVEWLCAVPDANGYILVTHTSQTAVEEVPVPLAPAQE